MDRHHLANIVRHVLLQVLLVPLQIGGRRIASREYSTGVPVDPVKSTATQVPKKLYATESSAGSGGAGALSSASRTASRTESTRWTVITWRTSSGTSSFRCFSFRFRSEGDESLHVSILPGCP